VICLAEGEPAAALSAVAGVLDGTAPVIGYTTVMEAYLLAALAYRQLGDQRAANLAAEHALTLAEQDRLVLPFVMTGSAELMETLPRHETAHAALLADILDLVHGASMVAKDQSAPPPTEELSPSEIAAMRSGRIGSVPATASRAALGAQDGMLQSRAIMHMERVAAGLLMLAGGLLYTAGALCYHGRRPDPYPAVFGYHEVFHAYVCAAAACQYVAIALFLTSQG
jgi:LuxR family maltose regulon positive regulatory protein